MGYGPLPGRQVPKDPHLLAARRCLLVVSSSIAPPFGGLSSCPGYVTHTLRTLPPRYYPSCPGIRARLAWVSHAASVRSEPGSNPSLEVSSPRPLREEASWLESWQTGSFDPVRLPPLDKGVGLTQNPGTHHFNGSPYQWLCITRILSRPGSQETWPAVDRPTSPAVIASLDRPDLQSPFRD